MTRPTADRLRQLNIDRLVLQTINNIETYGLAIIGVMGDDGIHAPLTYTAGMAESDLPEMMLSGVLPMHAHTLLNDTYAAVKDGKASLDVGSRIEGIVANGITLVVCAGLPNHMANIARSIYGFHVQVVQLIYPDLAGHYPWDEGYDLDPAVQGDAFATPEAFL